MKYITKFTKRNSIEGICNEYFKKGYRLHTCLKDVDVDRFTYLLIFEKVEI